jgi:hypothetical protein
MPVFCENCGLERRDDSRRCPKCGERFGGSLFVLLFGIVLGVIAPLALYIGVRSGEVVGGVPDDWMKILIVWELPIWTMTATLYDHSRVRSQIYFWVGGILTVLAVIWVAS